MKKVYILSVILICIILTKVIYDSNSLAKEQNAKSKLTDENLICKDCNVVIIGFDALQAKHISHLGYKRNTTPTLDKLAEKGISFSKNYAASSWTVPSFMSYFTSLYPSEHLVRNKFVSYEPDNKVLTNLEKLSPNVKTIAQAFKKAGYRTGGFTGDAGVNSLFGYAQGFDTYTDEVAFGSMDNSREHAMDWLDEDSEKPFFMFFHGYDAHGQFSGVDDSYKPIFGEANEFEITPTKQRDLREESLENGEILLSEEEVAAWNAWYDSKIFEADARIATFLEELEKRDLMENTIIVVISDHGTEIYEHRRFDHGYSLYNELINVPLLITWPQLTIGEINDVQVRAIDLVPTLFEITQIPTDEIWESQIRGESLFPAITKEDASNREVFSETDYRNYTHKRSVIDSEGWKYIFTLEDGTGEIYNLNDDPKEQHNLILEEKQRASSMKEEVLAHMDRVGESPTDEWPIGCLPVYNDQCLD